ncbi:MAG TPA: hypothetical protein ENN73_02470, partial [Firmicutes bacterium]|nr:hypothetical protein [Bacillota bacterium]
MDQQKRFLIAFGLTMVIVTIFMIMNPPKKPGEIKPEPVDIVQTDVETVTIPIVSSDTTDIAIETLTPEPFLNQVFEKQEETFSNDLFEVTFTNHGGAISSFKLNRFTNCDAENPERIDLVPNDIKNGIKIFPLSLVCEKVPALSESIYSFTKLESTQVDLFGVTPDNLQITKRYKIAEDTYSLELEIELLNTSTSSRDLKDLRINWGPGIIRTDLSKLDKRYFGPIFKVNDKKTTKQIKKKESEKKFEGSVDWILTGSKYYAVVLKESSETKQRASGAYYFVESDHQLNIGLYYDNITLEPDQPVTLKIKSYLGPKLTKEVDKFDKTLSEIASFRGIFGFLSNIFLEFMKFLYRYIPNYGIVIIIITLLFKLAFYPLTHTSMKSMKKMQEIQPILQELQKKYKDNPQLLQQETMRMY